MTGTDSTQIKVAKLALIGVIVAAIIGAIATIVSGYVSSDPDPSAGSGGPPAVPGTSTSTSAPRATATFVEPGPGTTHEPRTDVPIALVVSNLPASHVVWLLSRPEASAGQYGKTAPGPIAQRDGPVRYLDPEVGDETDSGSNYTYVAIEADDACDTEIAKQVAQFSRLPDSCTEIGTVTIPVN